MKTCFHNFFPAFNTVFKSLCTTMIMSALLTTVPESHNGLGNSAVLSLYCTV